MHFLTELYILNFFHYNGLIINKKMLLLQIKKVEMEVENNSGSIKYIMEYI